MRVVGTIVRENKVRKRKVVRQDADLRRKRKQK